jgi:two-component system response regulator AlgR
MIKVFIADDEEPARERLKELLGDIAEEVPTSVVGEARNGLETLERLPESGAELLLLDIQMPGMGGLEVARHLTSLTEAPSVVFVTAHERHAVALKKATVPDREQLAKAAQTAREYISVSERNRIVLVPVREIIFLRAEQKYVTLRTRNREHLIEEPLVSLEREFATSFVRIHRNCLVSRAAIRGFERGADGDDEPHWVVVLDGLEEKLPVSRRQWPALRELVAEK